MKENWIIFKIGKQNVFQIRYNSCIGKEVIESYKSMIAAEYGVETREVDAVLNESVLFTREESIVIKDLIDITANTLTKLHTQN
jgi:hypothetical protein